MGLSQAQAADKAGVTPNTWSRLENGGPVRRLSLSGIEKALGWAQGHADQLREGHGGRVDLPLTLSTGIEVEADGPERPTTTGRRLTVRLTLPASIARYLDTGDLDAIEDAMLGCGMAVAEGISARRQ